LSPIIKLLVRVALIQTLKESATHQPI